MQNPKPLGGKLFDFCLPSIQEMEQETLRRLQDFRDGVFHGMSSPFGPEGDGSDGPDEEGYLD